MKCFAGQDLLSSTAQTKMTLFRRYYIEGNFGDVPATQLKIFQPLLDAAKREARRHWMLRFDQDTEFVIFGDHPWDNDRMNFVQARLHDLTTSPDTLRFTARMNLLSPMLTLLRYVRDDNVIGSSARPLLRFRADSWPRDAFVQARLCSKEE